jgi:hypothetical protein
VASQNLILADSLVVSIAWAIACFSWLWRQAGGPDQPKRTRTRTALLLEAIAPRHQIAVLERSRTRLEERIAFAALQLAISPASTRICRSRPALRIW